MKKIIAGILSVAIMLVSVCSLSGCSNKSEKYVSRGEWIQMLGVQFGMDQPSSTTDYFSDVSQDEAVYPYVQATADWGVLEVSDSRFKPESTARVNFALETALKAAEVDTNGKSYTDYAKELGWISSDAGYKDVKGKLTKEKAQEILQKASDLYLSSESEPCEEAELEEGVKDLSAQTGIQETEGDTYVMDESTPELSEGDVAVFPGNEENPAGVAKKVKKVSKNADGTKKVETGEPEIDEVYKTLHINTTVVPKKENLKLASGVTLQEGANSLSTEVGKYRSKYFSGSGDSTNVVPLESSKGINYSLNVDFTKGKVSYNGEWKNILGTGTDVSVSGEDAYSIKSGVNSDAGQWFEKTSIIPDKTLFGKDPYDNTEAIEAYKSGAIGIDELKEKLNLTADQQEKSVSSMTNKFKGGYSITGKLSIKNLYVEPNLKLKKTIGVPTGIESFSVKVNYEASSSLKIEGTLSDELEIATWVVTVGSTGVTVNLKLVLYTDFNGELEFKVVVSNTTKVGYSDGKFKRTVQKSASPSLNASMTLDVGPGLTADLKFLGIDIVDATVTCKVRLKAEAGANLKTTYTESEENITINRATEFEYGIVAYAPIVDLSVGSSGTLAGKLKMSMSTTLVDEKRANKFNIIPKKDIVIWKEEQVIKLRPEEDDAQTTEEPASSSTPSSSKYLAIDRYYLALEEGNTDEIAVSSLPEGYTADQLVWSSSNTDIAQVKNGKVTGKGKGSCVISVRTEDGKYKAECAVDVTQELADNSSPEVEAA